MKIKISIITFLVLLILLKYVTAGAFLAYILGIIFAVGFTFGVIRYSKRTSTSTR